jgi:hypothetical protein
MNKVLRLLRERNKVMARKSVEVVFQEQGGINDVFLGINHYISTGDFYGAGMALDARAGLLRVVIP